MPEITIDIPLATPVPVVAPTQDYDLVMCWLSIAPREPPEGGLDYTASLSVRPYRLVDGKVDMAPESLTRTVSIGSVADAIVGQEPIGQAAAAILGVLTQFLGAADFKS